MSLINDDNELSMTELPMLPLRDVVVFPHMVIPLFVGREKSIQALEAAMDASKEILLVAQKDASEEDPGIADIYDVGTLSNILQMLKLPDGTVKVLVEGSKRVDIKHVKEGAFLTAEIIPTTVEEVPSSENEALVRTLTSEFENYGKLSKKVPAEILKTMMKGMRNSASNQA